MIYDYDTLGHHLQPVTRFSPQTVVLFSSLGLTRLYALGALPL
jgi:hypothetical protein